MTTTTLKHKFIYEGSAGRCPCCDKTTEIKLGNTLGNPSIPHWVVPEDVLQIIYSTISTRIKEKDGHLYVTDPSNYDASRRSKLFYVDADQGIAGPFGPSGLKVFLRDISFAVKNPESMRIYIVTTTDRALRIIRQSPFSRNSEQLNNDTELDNEDLF